MIGSRQTLHSIDSTYHHIKIIQEEEIRTLTFGGGQSKDQSAIDINDLRFHAFDYSLLSMYAFQFCPKPENILIIGLGGGVIPREYARYHPNAKIDVIELDPAIPDIAKEWFYFVKSDNTEIIIADGFDYLKNTKKKYDIIVQDAFFTNYIPIHLMSVMFLKFMQNALTYNGIAVFNTCKFRLEYIHHVNAMYEVFGDSIFNLTGIRNWYASMLYCLNNSKARPVDFDLNCSDDYIIFPPLIPEKLLITDEIKKAGPIVIPS